MAQDLSERLGYWTYAGRSRSRPTLFSKGHRSTTESDQRRALLMPQELMQMPANKLIVLRAGIPPIRGDKVVYWREKAFARRATPPPTVQVHKGFGPESPPAQPPAPSGPLPSEDDLSLSLVIPTLDAAGLPPPPDRGASEAAVKAWVERFIDATAQRNLERADHAR